MKKELGSPTVFPCPVVLVTAVDSAGKPNIITLAWIGQACSDPPCVTIAIRPQRHTHAMIVASGEFVVNIPGQDMLEVVDYCGTVSGRRVDKFAKTGLTPAPATHVDAPLIEECRVNLECTVVNTVQLGVHDLFIGRILTAHVDESVLTERGKVDYGKLRPFCYNPDQYWSLGQQIGTYGFSNKNKAAAMKTTKAVTSKPGKSGSTKKRELGD